MSEIEHYIGVNLIPSRDDGQVMDDLVHQLRIHPLVTYAVAMADGPEMETPEPAREDLPIMGREKALIDKLSIFMRIAAQRAGHATNDFVDHRRAVSFETLIHVDGEPTGHVARVTVELSRFDRDLVEAYQRERAGR